MILQPFPALLLIPCDLPVQAFHIRKLSFVTQKMQQLHPAGLFVQITGKIQQKCLRRRCLGICHRRLYAHIGDGIKTALGRVRPGNIDPISGDKLSRSKGNIDGGDCPGASQRCPVDNAAADAVRRPQHSGCGLRLAPP